MIGRSDSVEYPSDHSNLQDEIADKMRFYLIYDFRCVAWSEPNVRVLVGLVFSVCFP